MHGFGVFGVLLLLGHARAQYLPSASRSPSYNFHSKDMFLKENAIKLVHCVKNSLVGSTSRLPESVALKKSPDDRFVFEELFVRLYDGFCTTYEDKIKYLNSFSCDASQHLECRQVGIEKERPFAAQATPIMQCLCPDYSRVQAYLDNEKRGYYDKDRRICVMKVGQRCVVKPKSMDQRWIWNDFDYDLPNNTASSARSPPYVVFKGTGIEVAELRPLPPTLACVKHAFCFANSSNGLRIREEYRNRCVCESGYFRTKDGECKRGLDKPSWIGLFIAFAILLWTVVAFLGSLYNY